MEIFYAIGGEESGSSVEFKYMFKIFQIGSQM